MYNKKIETAVSRRRIPRYHFFLPLSVAEGRILELHSPDGVHECWLRAADNTEANVWFNALHSALAALTLKALRLASALPDPQQLQHIGWLARRHCLQVRQAPEYSLGEEVRLTRGNLLTCNNLFRNILYVMLFKLNRAFITQL